MGYIHKQPLSSLASQLAEVGNLRNFVETGTFVGDSLEWASRSFAKIWTIELNPHFFAEAKAKNATLQNVNFLLGDSATILPSVVAGLDGPALFWLDAHAGAGFFADHDICPLVAEIETILDSPHEHLIIVDDARAFVAPPPPPFDFTKWPSLDQIFKVVHNKNYHIVNIEDVLILVPCTYRSVVAQFCFSVRPNI